MNCVKEFLQYFVGIIDVSELGIILILCDSHFPFIAKTGFYWEMNIDHFMEINNYIAFYKYFYLQV